MLPERPVAPAATPVASEPEPAVYVVGTGDNLWTLARRYGCTVSALAAANNLTDPSALQVGQRLVIPGAPGLFLAGRPVATDVLPLTLNGCLMAPMRAVVEEAGGTVWWHSSSREVTARAGDKDLRLTIGRRAALVSGQIVEMDAAAALRSGRTLVPLRFLDETLGLPVTVGR
jgi:LysM repeat protein